jgi:hypothetical protein
LKGLKCGLTEESVRSAIEFLPLLAALRVFVVHWGWDLGREDITALAEALPGAYVAVEHCKAYDVEWGSPRYALKNSVRDHLGYGRYHEASAAAEQLFAGMDYTKPQFDSAVQQDALQNWLMALNLAATEERDPSERRNRIARAAQMADRILAMLPDDVESCRFADVARLRWSSLLAQANRCVYGGNPDLAGAKALFDIVQSETGDTGSVTKERVRTALREAGLDV